MLLVLEGRSGVTTAGRGLLKNRCGSEFLGRKKNWSSLQLSAFVTRQVGPGGVQPCRYRSEPERPGGAASGGHRLNLGRHLANHGI